MSNMKDVGLGILLGLIIIGVITLIIFSFKSKETPEANTITDTVKVYNVQYLVIDSCEYIRADGITHKGNCKFCKERNNK